MRATCPAHLILLDLITLTILVEQYMNVFRHSTQNSGLSIRAIHPAIINIVEGETDEDNCRNESCISGWKRRVATRNSESGGKDLPSNKVIRLKLWEIVIYYKIKNKIYEGRLRSS
jgi:hypothetical protein